MKKIIFWLVLNICFLGYTTNIYAVSFGKNKVIVDQKKWFIAETNHFYIYYYQDTEEHLYKVVRMLENAYDEITRRLEYLPSKKIPFFLYANHNDFEQNNIADVGEGTGGFAEAFKNRFVLPIEGSDKWLEKVITHEFIHIVTFYILYDGWKSARLIKSIFYPLWLIEGLAEYMSSDSDDRSFAEMVIRDAATSDLLLPLTHLQNFDHLEESYQIRLAYKEGEYALKYLAEKYGAEKVPILIKDLRDKFDINSIFSKLIKISFFEFDKNWRQHLKEKYSEEIKSKREPAYYGKQLTSNSQFNTNALWSNDGEKIAFISDREGYNDLFIMPVEGGSQKSFLKNKIWNSIDNVKKNGHALSFSPDDKEILFVGGKNKREYIFLFNIQKNKLKKLKIKNFDALSSPCFSPDGEKIVFVGMRRGVRDLFLADKHGKNIIQLNSDERNDDYPVFSPDGNKIVFVSEQNGQNDLYLLELSDKKITQLMNTPFEEKDPAWSPDAKNIIFVSDRDGVYNLYNLNLNTGIVVQLTNVAGGNFTPQFSPDGGKFLFSSYRRGEMNIYISDASILSSYESQIVEYPLLFIGTEEMIKQAEEEKEIDSFPETERFLSIISRKPYNLQVSTDLFFPMLFFSVPGGLFLANYWQASDMMGNHNFLAAVNYSGYDDWLIYQVSYAYKKFRPQFYFYFTGRKDDYFYNDVNFGYSHVKRMNHSEELVISYPFNTSNRIDIGIVTAMKSERNRTKNDEIREYIENGASISLVRDTTKWKFLEIMSGGRTNFTMYQAKKIWGGTYEYREYILDSQRFFTIMKNDVLAFRFLGLNSEGEDKQFYYLPARGASRKEYENNKIMLFTGEARIFIFSGINYYMWYMIPDLYFKSLQAIIFTDTGIGWDKDERVKNMQVTDLTNSVGLGLRLNTFILQRFPLFFEVDGIRRTDKEKWEAVFSMSLNRTF